MQFKYRWLGGVPTTNAAWAQYEAQLAQQRSLHDNQWSRLVQSNFAEQGHPQLSQPTNQTNRSMYNTPFPQDTTLRSASRAAFDARQQRRRLENYNISNELRNERFILAAYTGLVSAGVEPGLANMQAIVLGDSLRSTLDRTRGNPLGAPPRVDTVEVPYVGEHAEIFREGVRAAGGTPQ